ncbi:MAG: hypothetical protein AB1765_05045 [Candidatus Hydrogenedentota bacterium]
MKRLLGLFFVFISLFLLFSTRLNARDYYNIYENRFISFAILYERISRDIELDYRTTDTATLLPFYKDKQTINMNNFALQTKINFTKTIAGFLETGITDLKGEYHNFGDTVGTLNFKAKNSFLWGVGLEADLFEFKTGLNLRGKIQVSGWNVNVEYGALKNVQYGAWLFLEQKIYFNKPLYASPRELYYLKPYIGVGYTRDDLDGDLYTSNIRILKTPGKNTEYMSLKLGADFRMTNLILNLEGNIIDQKSFRISAGTKF